MTVVNGWMIQKNAQLVNEFVDIIIGILVEYLGRTGPDGLLLDFH